VAIVQREPMAVEPCRDNGVIFFPVVVPQDHNAKVISGNACPLESNELCDRVIFAVPRRLWRMSPTADSRRPPRRKVLDR
jgi:hypothetical protein